MKSLVEEIKSLPISDATAGFIASLRSLQDVYAHVSDAVCAVYGDIQGESLQEEKMTGAYHALEDSIKELMVMAISENLSNVTLKEI